MNRQTASFGNISWFTNTGHGVRHDLIELRTMEENLLDNARLRKKLAESGGILWRDLLPAVCELRCNRGSLRQRHSIRLSKVHGRADYLSGQIQPRPIRDHRHEARARQTDQGGRQCRRPVPIRQAVVLHPYGRP